MTSDPTFLDFSTSMFPDRRKREALCEIIGKEVLKVDVSVPRAEVPSASIRFRALDGAGVSSGLLSNMRFDHAAHLSNDDDIVFLISQAGDAVLHQRGVFTEVQAGSGTVMANGESASFRTAGSFKIQTLRFQRDRLQTRVRDLESKIAASVSPRSLAPILTYANDILSTPQANADAGAVAHLYDLAAIALGGSTDRYARLNPGLRAARLRALKADILRHLTQPTLSVTALARRHRISERYIQRLFLDSGSSLSEFILTRRAEHAQQMLLDPRCEANSISDIAFDAGFSDLSHFNRVFRRRFAQTPSDARETLRANATLGTVDEGMRKTRG